ncbi:MAG: outer membrane protein [Thermoproteota archaeon]|jgi:outer membrane protein
MYRPLILLAIAILIPCAHALNPVEKLRHINNEKSLYELGIFHGSLLIPDYPTSDQNSFHEFILPTFIYRGKVLRSDRDGTRAFLFASKEFKIDFSFSAAFPSKANDNKAREGMDDLLWLGEMGPRISWTLKFKNPNYTLRMNIPLRQVFTTDFSYTKFIGININPSILLIKDKCFSFDLRCTLGSDFNWVDSNVANHFYQVKQADVTLDRPLFNAKSGILGQSLYISFTKPLTKSLTTFAFMNYNNHSLAKNKESPLFKTNENYSIFVGFSWVYFYSKDKVRVDG